MSNPTSQVEALPADIIQWTEGKALIATGSPFAPVHHQGHIYPIAQCNNAYIFPGVGLGVIAAGAQSVTDLMLMAASNALARCSPMLKNPDHDLLPSIGAIQDISKIIALQVGLAAIREGVAPLMDEASLQKAIEAHVWKPEYRDYRRITF